ncbi:MAG TPA: diguanylate cyclase [Mycobacteriales bacterium]|nr:diguanylate cyclase [Mycobacteriales bacterium]
MRKRAQWIVVTAVAVGAIAAIAAVGVVIANQQHSTREADLRRFDQRAQISAALTQSLFGSLATLSTADLENRFGGTAGQLRGRIHHVMASTKAQATQTVSYVAVLDDQGRLLASGGATPRALGATRLGSDTTMTDVQPTAHGPAIGYIARFPLPDGGQRVLIEGVPVQTLRTWLNAYLAKLPNPDESELRLTDSNGRLLAHTLPPNAQQAAVGGDTVSTSVPVPTTDWRLRLTAPRSLALPSNQWLYWLPWVLLAALGASAVAALLLYRRLVRTASRERRAYAELDENRQQLAALVGVLEEIADCDSLTGLWNRRRFDRELGNQIARCRRLGESAALLILDVDGFKHINDTFGHSRGDEALRAIAHALTARLRETDGAARIGGDEFAVLLVGTAPDDARRLAGELSDELTAISRTEAQGLPVSMSVGVALLDAATADAAAAFDAADRDMYTDKARRQPALREQLPRQRFDADEPAIDFVAAPTPPLEGIIASPWV